MSDATSRVLVFMDGKRQADKLAVREIVRELEIRIEELEAFGQSVMREYPSGMLADRARDLLKPAP